MAGAEVDAAVVGAATAERIGAGAEAGGDVAAGHRRARRHGRALQLAVEQQRLEHRQLAAGRRQLALHRVHVLDQAADRHVVHRADAAKRDLLVEVELAVAQVADLGQALAQRVEAVGLGLQLGHAGGQGVDLALGRAAGVFDRRTLAVQLGLQAGDLRRAHAGAGQHAGHGDHRGGGERLAPDRAAGPFQAARQCFLDALARLVPNAV